PTKYKAEHPSSRLEMKNEEIASRFGEIADMLDILGEDTFRILSYQRAARQLESLTENVEDLVREGRVDQIPGIGPALGEKITERMKASKTVERIEAAGSFRRMRETVGDVDILAVARNRAAAGAAFERLPGVVEVLASGETKVVIRIEYHDYEGSPRTIQVDLRILDPDSWGAGLQYFTGSKDHNIRLRTMAERRGLKMNEYGVFRDEKRIAGDTEESMYS